MPVVYNTFINCYLHVFEDTLSDHIIQLLTHIYKGQTHSLVFNLFVLKLLIFKCSLHGISY